jgi:hypothetical protein
MSDRTRITDDPEWVRWVQVTRETWGAEAKWARSTLGLARTAVRGDLDPAGAARAYLTSARREGGRYWRTASRLGAEYARDLTALASQVTAGVVDEVMQARRGASTTPRTKATAAGASAGAATDVGAHLAGPVGGAAVGTITVANRHPRTRRIEISAGPVRDVGGATVPGLRLLAQPGHVTLASGEESTVALSVDLSAAAAAAGERYRCTVSVTGGDEAVVECEIDVT